MKLRTSIGALGATAVILAASLVSQADPIASDKQPKAVADATVEAGKYVDLNFWRKLKLATAAYVNPDLITTAEVAYAYDPAVFDSEVSPELIQAMKDGRVWLARASDDGSALEVLPATEALRKELADADLTDAATATDQWMELLKGEQMNAGNHGVTMTVVSRVDILLGKQPEKALVTWSPKGPVTSPKPKPDTLPD